MTTVLLVEYPAAVRWALRARLSLEPDLDIVGEADDGDQALRLARELKPEVVVVDAETPDLNAYAVARALVKQEARQGIVVVCVDTTGARCDLGDTPGLVVGKHKGLPALVDAIRTASTGPTDRGRDSR